MSSLSATMPPKASSASSPCSAASHAYGAVDCHTIRVTTIGRDAVIRIRRTSASKGPLVAG